MQLICPKLPVFEKSGSRKIEIRRERVRLPMTTSFSADLKKPPRQHHIKENRQKPQPLKIQKPTPKGWL